MFLAIGRSTLKYPPSISGWQARGTLPQGFSSTLYGSSVRFIFGTALMGEGLGIYAIHWYRVMIIDSFGLFCAFDCTVVTNTSRIFSSFASSGPVKASSCLRLLIVQLRAYPFPDVVRLVKADDHVLTAYGRGRRSGIGRIVFAWFMVWLHWKIIPLNALRALRLL